MTSRFATQPRSTKIARVQCCPLASTVALLAACSQQDECPRAPALRWGRGRAGCQGVRSVATVAFTLVAVVQVVVAVAGGRAVEEAA